MDPVGLWRPQARPFRASDRLAVTDLLDICPRLYPGGDRWLQRRLTDVLHGRAQCTVVHAPHSSRLYAVAISTPKPSGCVKLSTFFVAEDCRQNGLGTFLLHQLMEVWNQQDLKDVYVTVAHHVEAPLARLIEPAGFLRVAMEKNRYGPGRHEAVWVRP